MDSQVGQRVNVLIDGMIVVFTDLGAIDLLVLGRQGILFRRQQFFVEFFAGTEAGVFDFDVFTRTETGEFYHPAGKVGDFDRRSHIEDEDFVAFAHEGGFEDEAAGFGDGHKVTDDFGMGYGERSTLC